MVQLDSLMLVTTINGECEQQMRVAPIAGCEELAALALYETCRTV
jgi:hypothetical protein